MRVATDYITLQTKQRRELVRITDDVRRFVESSKIVEGMVLVSAMHITASVFVNDDEPGLHADIWRWLERLAPPADYEHHRTGEDNGEAHLRSLLLHHEVMVPITKGDLDFGPWQQIFYAEFDGQRKKRIVLKAFGAGAQDLESSAKEATARAEKQR